MGAQPSSALFGPVPVGVRNAWTGYPDFTDLARLDGNETLRIDD